MGRKVAGARSVKVTVPVSTEIVQGNFYLLAGFFGMALQSVTTDAATTSEVILEIDQAEYETDQITEADAFAVGAPVYWDDATSLMTVVAGENRQVGRVTTAKDANNVIWFILGPQVV